MDKIALLARRRLVLLAAGIVTFMAAAWIAAPVYSVDDAASQKKNANAVKQPQFKPADIAFFEKKVKPLLEARCFKCHGPKTKKLKGGLRLDSRAAVLKGGETGPAAVPGKPKKSLLIEAINYDGLEMPPRTKLPKGEIAILTRWVQMGMPFSKGSGKPAVTHPDAFPLEKRKRSHWAWKPVMKPALPSVTHTTWAVSPIDRFILAKLEAKGIAPAATADRRTLIRRAYFDLIGLPPTAAEVAAFINDSQSTRKAFASVIDRLLKSSHFGERWGRHWLDLVRYADTLGHEFDYPLRHAHQYRDYVIRAFNADVPYDRFVTEHIAGDLMPAPRRHPKLGYNESIIGTGFWFLGEDKHAPVDVKGEEAAKVDNQLDVFSKTFLGLTVACARCHDHKFDAITTKDYYALSGFLQSSRRHTALLDPRGDIGRKAAELRKLKLAGEELIRKRISSIPSAKPSADRTAGKSKLFADFNGKTFAGWRPTGFAFGDMPTRSGEWDVHAVKSQFLEAGVAHSRRFADKLGGVLRSPTFTITHDQIFYRVKGKGARIRLIIDGYVMDEFSGLLFKGCLQKVNTGGQWKWLRQAGDIHRYKGRRAHIELIDDGDGWLAIDEIRFASNGDSPPPRQNSPATQPPADRRLVDLRKKIHDIQKTIPNSMPVIAMTDGSPEDEHVFIRGSHKSLGPVVHRRMLAAVSGSKQPAIKTGSGRLELARRMLHSSNPFPARVMVNRIWHHLTGQGIVASVDNFGVLGQRPTHPELLDHLASTFVAPPLDKGGIEGCGWSVKRMIRRVMLSNTYMMSSTPNPAAEKVDPQNRLLHRMRIRRLQGEAIRDAMLAVSHRLDRKLYGPSVPVYLTRFMQGRGRPRRSGPLDGNGRRSIYIAVRRNFLSPMMIAFDTPIPFNAIGRRNVSNVPAQALTLKQGHSKNAKSVDKPIAGLLTDLKKRGLLKDTLVLWTGEFGRTPFAQGRDGRDHNPFGFSLWMAGGGIKGGTVYGATDEFGYKAVTDRLEMHDLHATMLHLLGMDHEKLTYRFSGRDMRLTDVAGHVIKDVLA